MVLPNCEGISIQVLCKYDVISCHWAKPLSELHSTSPNGSWVEACASQRAALAVEECAPRRCVSFDRALTFVELCLSELEYQSCPARFSFPAKCETVASLRPDIRHIT